METTAPGQALRVRWTPGYDGAALQEDSVPLATGTVRLDVPFRREPPLEIGPYRLDVSIDDEAVAFLAFEVKEDATASCLDTPAPGAGVTSPRLRHPAAEPDPPRPHR